MIGVTDAIGLTTRRSTGLQHLGATPCAAWSALARARRLSTRARRGGQDLMRRPSRAWKVQDTKEARRQAADRPESGAGRTTASVNNGLSCSTPWIRLDWPRRPRERSSTGRLPFVGFAVSFPRADQREPVEYKVNPVFLTNVFGWDGEDEDESRVTRLRASGRRSHRIRSGRGS